MTDMKKISLLFVSAVCLVGCNKELSEIPNDDNLISVNLSLSGEVSTIDEPLTRAEESNALIGIQVYQNGSPYAWGLFDSTDGLCLYLHSGSQYSIKCQYIKNGKEVLYCFNKTTDANTPTYLLTGKHTILSGKYQGVSEWNNVTNGPGLSKKDGYYQNFHRNDSGYSVPFDIIDNYYPSSNSDDLWCLQYKKYATGRYWRMADLYYSGGYSPDYSYDLAGKTHTICEITNRFMYDSDKMINISESAVIKSDSSYELDRYYGESGSFTASSESNRIISLDMKHLVYGIQCNVTGVSDGVASITIANENRTLLNKDSISGEYHSETKIFAFSDMHGAWQYSDNYTENVTISMTWLRGVGVLQDLGSQVVQVKRNCMNVISVSLSTGTTRAVSSDLSFSDEINTNSYELFSSCFPLDSYSQVN